MFSSNNIDVSPWLCLLICSYPVTETIFSIYRKLKRKAHNPGSPDKVHLHMLIYRRFSKKFFNPNHNSLFNRNAFSALIMLIFPLISCIFAIISVYFIISPCKYKKSNE